MNFHKRALQSPNVSNGGSFISIIAAYFPGKKIFCKIKITNRIIVQTKKLQFEAKWKPKVNVNISVEPNSIRFWKVCYGTILILYFIYMLCADNTQMCITFNILWKKKFFWQRFWDSVCEFVLTIIHSLLFFVDFFGTWGRIALHINRTNRECA